MGDGAEATREGLVQATKAPKSRGITQQYEVGGGRHKFSGPGEKYPGLLSTPAMPAKDNEGVTGFFPNAAPVSRMVLRGTAADMGTSEYLCLLCSVPFANATPIARSGLLYRIDPLDCFAFFWMLCKSSTGKEVKTPVMRDNAKACTSACGRQSKLLKASTYWRTATVLKTERRRMFCVAVSTFSMPFNVRCNSKSCLNYPAILSATSPPIGKRDMRPGQPIVM